MFDLRHLRHFIISVVHTEICHYSTATSFVVVIVCFLQSQFTSTVDCWHSAMSSVLSVTPKSELLWHIFHIESQKLLVY